MRELYILAATLAPLFVLGLLERSGAEPATWVRIVCLTWFAAGALYIGWYDGWVKRALVGLLIAITLMGIFILWTGALPGGWPTAVNVLLVLASATALVVVGLVTGWFAEMEDAIKRALGRAGEQAKDVEPR
jgi:hypothetical protein